MQPPNQQGRPGSAGQRNRSTRTADFARLAEPKGASMNISNASRIIGAMLITAIASGAAYANAQQGMSATAGAVAQRVAASGSPPRPRPDTSIVRDVRRALRRVPDMDDSEIHIRASHGVVTLTGSVPESWQISRAGNAARSVLGVKSVTNRLTERKSDAASIEQRLAASAG
ncbi:BON domain-containing protein [Paraburkholderia sp. MM5384-R2]|uniref:BON domain-containing protein n=1 Tax=Paraburkholderia sp. MM5384-R2 TaxID=2723097 RepID=UPI00288A4F28|nr:BON domain-containing protein [Paraburkholderia sp. MM5384-R2]